jgi:hypothetical protein
MVKGEHKRVIKKDKRSLPRIEDNMVCIYYTRVVNQYTGGCDHGFALSLLSYCHYAKVIVTRPMMDTVC